MKKTTILVAGAAAAFLSSAQGDVVHADDTIVQGSLAVGMDAVNNESFGFDTIRLKENNLRIKFDDTSSSSGFPSNDWQLTANDSNSGGANKFSIDDVTNGKTPFTVEGNTPSNSLYLDSSGKIGLGTTNPALWLHQSVGDTPSLRLDQNGSAGWTAQVWDVAGNEANFFVRDVTGGSLLPFRIKPGAPTNSLYIDTDGVGIGLINPTNQLHVQETADNQVALIENTNGTSASRTVLELKNNGASALRMSSDSVAWDVIAADEETFTIGLQGETATVTLSGAGGMTVAGNVVANGVTLSSDRNIKNNIRPVEPSEILKKVVEMPVSEWSYKRDDARGIRHIGPMAQDFRAQFGLGNTDKGIDMVDSAGVALAAIQGLHEVIEAKDRDIEDLRASNAELSKKLEALALKVESMGAESTAQ